MKEEVLLGVQQIDVISFMQMQLYGCFPLNAERGRKWDLPERHLRVDDLANALSGEREMRERRVFFLKLESSADSAQVRAGFI